MYFFFVRFVMTSDWMERGSFSFHNKPPSVRIAPRTGKNPAGLLGKAAPGFYLLLNLCD